MTNTGREQRFRPSDMEVWGEFRFYAVRTSVTTSTEQSFKLQSNRCAKGLNGRIFHIFARFENKFKKPAKIFCICDVIRIPEGSLMLLLAKKIYF